MSKTLDSAKNIRTLLKPHRKALFGVAGISVASASAEAIGLALFSILINQMMNMTPMQSHRLSELVQFSENSPAAFFLVLASTYVLKSVLALASNYFSVSVALKIADHWRMRLVRALLGNPVRNLPQRQGGALQLVLDEPANAGSGLAAAGIMIQNLVSAITIYTTLLFISVQTAVILTGIGILSLAVLLRIFRYSRRLGVHRTQAYKEGYSYISEAISAMRQVRIFGLERRVEGRIDELVTRMRQVIRKSIVISSSPRLIIELIFIIVFVVAIAVMIPIAGKETVMGSAGLAAVAAMRLLPSFSAAAGVWVQVQQAVPAMQRIGTELSRLEEGLEAGGGLPAPVLRKDIVVSNLTFSYPDRDPVLKEVGFSIKAFEFTAIVGPSGSGKSTVLEIICGLHEPTSGCVLVDGIDLRDLSKESWRQQLGVVPQDGFLMAGTVRDNLKLLVPDVSDEVMFSAVEAVGATSLIAGLPQGYDTVIGERGFSLSGGQRQRLALARVLVRQPQVLLLDEATSALDAESDEFVFKTVANLRGRMTVIAVAHRLASIRHADTIHVMHSGRVVESGTHESLVRAGGVYTSLQHAAETVAAK